MVKLNNQILRDIGILARSIHSINDICFRRFKLQRSQFIFITRVCEHPGINHISLSVMLKVDKATTTKAVQKLMAAGYIMKVRSNSDKREWQLYATEQAQIVYDEIIRQENLTVERCFAGMSQSEQEKVCALIRRMSANMESVWRQSKAYGCK